MMLSRRMSETEHAVEVLASAVGASMHERLRHTAENVDVGRFGRVARPEAVDSTHGSESWR